VAAGAWSRPTSVREQGRKRGPNEARLAARDDTALLTRGARRAKARRAHPCRCGQSRPGSRSRLNAARATAISRPPAVAAAWPSRLRTAANGCSRPPAERRRLSPLPPSAAAPSQTRFSLVHPAERSMSALVHDSAPRAPPDLYRLPLRPSGAAGGVQPPSCAAPPRATRPDRAAQRAMLHGKQLVSRMRSWEVLEALRGRAAPK
jgi:hypothetical protein